MTEHNWLIYALGGGWGHVTRSFALARAAGKRGIATTVFTNSEYAQLVLQSELYKAASGLCTFQVLAAKTAKDDVETVVRNLLSEGKYTRLVVDTFPRGLTGDLVDIIKEMQPQPQQQQQRNAHQGLQPVLISRDLNPEYVVKFGVAEFINQNFKVVINPGEEQNLFVCSGNDISIDLPIHDTAPWTVLDGAELPSLQESRHRLGISDPQLQLVLVVASGTPAENKFYWQVAQRLQTRLQGIVIRFLAAEPPENHDKDCSSCSTSGANLKWISHYPGIECMFAADAVVGGAGYNTISECQSTGVPLIAFPKARLYDRQKLRAVSRAKGSAPIFPVGSAEEAESILLRILNARSKNPCLPISNTGVPDTINGLPNSVNGVHEAVEIIRSSDWAQR